ncbi:HPP family protein [Dasania marina]|uniref:HPP family protein n=1 Tax=Dasania marina TaxID=471499 RepID=UPI0003812F64|nr:HPP family protein [Dasania marina]
MFKTLTQFIGLEHSTTSHKEKFISALGALLGIAAIYGLSSLFFSGWAATLIVASMGATAVLLFAVPHGTLSQPWAVVMGHAVSALIGISCQKYLGQYAIAPALAVGLAVGAMSYLRCIHPPGGATALTAVIGGPEIADLGYGYLLNPIALNVLAIMAIALIFNNCFYWRRYPHALMATPAKASTTSQPLHLNHEDLSAAMHAMDTYIDVSSEELALLFEKAWAHSRLSRSKPIDIGVLGCYSNAGIGNEWCIRQVLEMPSNSNDKNARLLYKNLAGADVHNSGICTAEEFAQWASFEVVLELGRWSKAIPK